VEFSAVHPRLQERCAESERALSCLTPALCPVLHHTPAFLMVINVVVIIIKLLSG
jgi:hypothetical protein